MNQVMDAWSPIMGCSECPTYRGAGDEVVVGGCQLQPDRRQSDTCPLPDVAIRSWHGYQLRVILQFLISNHE